jgi:hypothetical protein
VQLPEVSAWIEGPGGLLPNNTPWSEVKTKFAFVDELEQLRTQIHGAGNLARFDYWLSTYRAAALMAELGTIANLEQHTRRHLKFLEVHDEALAKALGKPLPPEVQPGSTYDSPAKIIVPAVRSVLRLHEPLKLTIMVLDQEQPKQVMLYSRAMGDGPWRQSPATTISRCFRL